jgi:hypothetical protein
VQVPPEGLFGHFTEPAPAPEKSFADKAFDFLHGGAKSVVKSVDGQKSNVTNMGDTMPSEISGIGDLFKTPLNILGALAPRAEGDDKRKAERGDAIVGLGSTMIKGLGGLLIKDPHARAMFGEVVNHAKAGVDQMVGGKLGHHVGGFVEGLFGPKPAAPVDPSQLSLEERLMPPDVRAPYNPAAAAQAKVDHLEPHELGAYDPPPRSPESLLREKLQPPDWHLPR